MEKRNRALRSVEENSPECFQISPQQTHCIGDKAQAAPYPSYPELRYAHTHWQWATQQRGDSWGWTSCCLDRSINLVLSSGDSSILCQRRCCQGSLAYPSCLSRYLKFLRCVYLAILLFWRPSGSLICTVPCLSDPHRSSVLNSKPPSRSLAIGLKDMASDGRFLLLCRLNCLPCDQSASPLYQILWVDLGLMRTVSLSCD